MEEYRVGDRVRVDIPNHGDPDYNRFHGRHGIVTEVLPDDAGAVTSDDRDSALYRVRLADGTEMDFRWRQLRPP